MAQQTLHPTIYAIFVVNITISKSLDLSLEKNTNDMLLRDD